MKSKAMSAAEALMPLRSGQRVLVGSGAAAPQELIDCSLGVSVDVVKAAVESAAYVEGGGPIFELPAREATAEALWIGRYVRELVEDGSTIQAGIGAVPDAVLAALAGKKDLGVHSEMISDGVLDLVVARAVTGQAKSLHPGRVVTSFCMGSRRLYDAVAENPKFLFTRAITSTIPP